jgi:hypothetical protein
LEAFSLFWSKAVQMQDYTAAGVLPYTVYGGQILFLLGKEQYISRSSSGGRCSRLVWSDFGGRRESTDANAEHTAAREFSEETLGLFSSLHLDAASVGKSEGAMLSGLNSSAGVFRTQNGLYSMFIAKVDYMECLMFTIARKVSDGQGGAEQSLDRSEKLEWLWVPSSALVQALEYQESLKHRNNVVVRLGVKSLRMFYKFVISLRGQHFTHSCANSLALGGEGGLTFRDVVESIARQELSGNKESGEQAVDDFGRTVRERGVDSPTGAAAASAAAATSTTATPSHGGESVAESVAESVFAGAPAQHLANVANQSQRKAGHLEEGMLPHRGDGCSMGGGNDHPACGVGDEASEKGEEGTRRVEDRDGIHEAVSREGGEGREGREEREEREERDHLWRSIGALPTVQSSRKHRQLGLTSSPPPELARKRKKRRRRRKKGVGGADAKAEAEAKAKEAHAEDESWRMTQMLSREAEAAAAAGQFQDA